MISYETKYYLNIYFIRNFTVVMQQKKLDVGRTDNENEM